MDVMDEMPIRFQRRSRRPLERAIFMRLAGRKSWDYATKTVNEKSPIIDILNRVERSFNAPELRASRYLETFTHDNEMKKRIYFRNWLCHSLFSVAKRGRGAHFFFIGFRGNE